MISQGGHSQHLNMTLNAHKRRDSDLNLVPPTDLVETSVVSPSSLHSTSTTMSRTSQSKKEPLLKESGCGTSSSSASTSPSGHSESGCLEAWMLCKGDRVVCKRTSSRVSWKPAAGGSVSSCCGTAAEASTRKILYDEILSAWLVSPDSSCGFFSSPNKDFPFTIYSLEREKGKPSSWNVREDTLAAPTLEQAKEWVVAINSAVALNQDRPRSLLIFVNPVSGSWQSRELWKARAAPVFQKARIRCTVIETQRTGHAIEVIAGMKAEEMEQYQGLVAVGGDGLFQELVIGLVKQRGAGMSKGGRMRVGHIPGGSTDAVAYTLHNTRSVEAAALHIALGDRQMLDVARVDAQDGSHRHFVCQAAYGFLGDVMKFSEGLRMLGPSRYDLSGALKYLQLKSYRMLISYQSASDTRLDTICAHRCHTCNEAGNIVSLPMASDAANTFLTPAKVAAAAAAGKAAGKAATAVPPTQGSSSSSSSRSSRSSDDEGKLVAKQQPGQQRAAETLPTPLLSSTTGKSDEQQPGDGAAAGRWQSGASAKTAGGAGAAAAAAADGPDGVGEHSSRDEGGGAWTSLEGEFISVMSVVTPCRSDKSKKGLVPTGHLADGRMYLVLVRKCNHLQYIRFLLLLSGSGLHDLCLPFVRVLPVTAVKVCPVGEESSWNVDGELMTNNNVSIRVHRGLVDVFARGVEVTAPTL